MHVEIQIRSTIRGETRVKVSAGIIRSSSETKSFNVQRRIMQTGLCLNRTITATCYSERLKILRNIKCILYYGNSILNKISVVEGIL